jgi:hypothetical protein
MRVGAVLAAALVAVAVGLAIVLLDTAPRQAGTNSVPESGEALTIEGSGSHCQGDQVIPADAASLRLLLGTFERPTPELDVSVRARGETISSGRLPAGGREGRVVIPIEPVAALHDHAEVCIEVRAPGEGRRIVLYGVPGQVRFEWLRAGEESWLELLPTVAHRFGLGKPFLSGAWVLGLAAALLAAAWAVALRTTVRELRR